MTPEGRTTRERSHGSVRIKDVADLAGVSIGTVSNVVTGNRPVTPAYEKRVREALDALGYVPNETARHLRIGSSKTIGLVLTDLTNPFFVNLALGAERAAAEAGYGLLMGSSPEGSDREARYIGVFERQRVDGILVTPPGSSRTLINRLRGNGAKIVLVERKDSDEHHCSISGDDYQGGLQVGQHLVRSGRKRLWFVGGPVVMTQMAERLQGFQDALLEGAGVRAKVIPTDDLTLGRGAEIGHMIANLGDDRPDGIFAANDLVALGVMKSLRESGVHVPSQVAVIGYDNIPFAETTVPQLTSVNSLSDELGYRAVQMLIAELEEGPAHEHRHEALKPQLILRQSA